MDNCSIQLKSMLHFSWLSLLQIGSLPAYQGLTLAGILATSAHGSGDLTVHSLADTVLEVTWVDGRGSVHVSRPSDPEFKALNGGLGMFGVITELLLQLTPPTNTELITVVKSDKDMMNEINRLLKVRKCAPADYGIGLRA
jgi:FAD/FMN-containing dehydrogenase